jgi:hypothetical protein
VTDEHSDGERKPSGADSLETAKEAAWYGAVVQAWIATRMERDRTVVTLAAGGVALLVTLLTTRQRISEVEFVLYFFATVAFIIAIVAGTMVFERNSGHLQDVLKDGDAHDPVLKNLDRVAGLAFYVGLFLALTIGMVTSASRLERAPKGGTRVPNNNERIVQPRPISITPSKAPETRSLEGVGQLRPGSGGKPQGEAPSGGKGADAKQ